MATYVLGIVFLLACLFGVPLLKRVLHERAVKGLGMDGVRVVAGGWRPSGLRIERAAWGADVHFESPGLAAGRPGHLRLVADFRKAAPQLLFPKGHAGGDAVRTGDDEFDRKIAVVGDAAFARKLLVPEMRARLLRLDELGGRVIGIGAGAIEIDGPYLLRSEDLKRFLELCDAVVDATAAAAG